MGKLTTKHLMFIIPGLTIVSIKTYPTIFTRLGGRDTWIALMIASLIMFAFFTYILWICKKSNTYNIVEIYRGAFGNIIGNILIGFFLLTMVFTIFESSAVEANAMKINFLIYTPQWWFMIATIIVGIYVVKNEYSVITTIMISIFFISTSGVILAILTHKYKEYKYLSPILSEGVTLDFVWCIFKLLGAYGCIMIALIFINNLKDQKKLIKHSIISMIFIIQIQIVSMVGVITTFGIDRLDNIIYPKLIQTQLVSHFDFLEAGEFFVMFQIVDGWLVKYIIALFATLKLLELLGLSNKYNVYILSIIAFFVSFYCNKNILNLFSILDYLMYIQLINFIIIPTIVFTVFYAINKAKLKVN